MAAKATKIRSHRRDRRLAKAGGYTRQGKIGMGSRVGHGTHGKGRPSSVGRKKNRKENKTARVERSRQIPSRLVSLAPLLRDADV